MVRQVVGASRRSRGPPSMPNWRVGLKRRPAPAPPIPASPPVPRPIVAASRCKFSPHSRAWGEGLAVGRLVLRREGGDMLGGGRLVDDHRGGAAEVVREGGRSLIGVRQRFQPDGLPCRSRLAAEGLLRRTNSPGRGTSSRSPPPLAACAFAVPGMASTKGKGRGGTGWTFQHGRRHSLRVDQLRKPPGTNFSLLQPRCHQA